MGGIGLLGGIIYSVSGILEKSVGFLIFGVALLASAMFVLLSMSGRVQKLVSRN